MWKANFCVPIFYFMIFIIPRLAKDSFRPGVYRILFDNKWLYIGSSGDVANRIRRWHSCINGNVHYKNINMKMVLPETKEIRFEILEYFETPEQALEREGQLLKEFGDYEWLLNRCPESDSPKGVRPYIGQQLVSRKAHLPKSAYYKPVAKFDEDGRLLEKYESVKASALANGVIPKRISAAIKGNMGKCKGFVFKYVNKDGSFDEPGYKKRNYKVNRPYRKYPGKKVLQINNDGIVVAEHYGLCNAAKAVNLKSGTSIHAAITNKRNTAAGYRWQYA